MDPKAMRVGEPGDELVYANGLRLVFVMTPSGSEGRRLEMDWFVPPGEALVAADHYHPESTGDEVLNVRQIIASHDPTPEITGGVQGSSWPARLAGPQRALPGGLSTAARAAGKRAYREPEFASRAPSSR